jgi:hypothetical protein
MTVSLSVALLALAEPVHAASSLWDWTQPEGSIPGDANAKGMWDGPWDLTDGYGENPDSNWHSERNPVHGALLRSGTKGKVLMYRHFHWYVFDLNTADSETILELGDTSTPGLQWAFCSGHSFLPDGRLLVTGGDHQTYGPPQNLLYPVHDPVKPMFEVPPWAAIFDANSSTPPVPVDDMLGNPRWYPTNLTMPDGDVWVVSGNFWVDANGSDSVEAGEYSPVTDWIEWDAPTSDWSLVTSAPLGLDAGGHPIETLPLYPFMHVLPSKLFYAGYQPSNRIKASCPHCESLLWDWTVHSTSGDWGVANFAASDDDRRKLNHDHGTSVLLTLAPPYGAARLPYAVAGSERVLLIGGGDNSIVYSDTSGVRGPHSGVELFDLGLPPDQRWQRVDNMLHARKHVNGVLLPDGKVFVSGGHYVANPCFGSPCGSGTNVAETPVLPAERFDPQAAPTQQWAEMDALNFTYGRGYHSFGLLLPDGRVLTAGNNTGWHADSSATHNADVAGDNYEIFYPPYLFTSGNELISASARPQIVSAPSDVFYGLPFFIDVDDAGDVSEVMLIALSVATHANNMSQRRVLLEWEVANTNPAQIVATAPWHGAVAPPGDYMLFVRDNSTTRVPSVARFLRLSQATSTAQTGSNTVWGGRVRLDRDFTVDAGDTLEIRPGTEVYCEPIERVGAGISGLVELAVLGNLQAIGASGAGNQITFTTSTESGNFYGVRFDLAGEASTAYGYVGSLEPPSRLSFVTIENATVGVEIAGLCAPGLEQVTFTNTYIPDPPNDFARDILLNQTDVVLPYGRWTGHLPEQVEKDPVRWDLEAPTNVVATNTVLPGKNHPLGYGDATKVDLFGDGPILTNNASGPVAYVAFRPETRNDDLAEDWGGIEVHWTATGTWLRYADIGHAADPLFFAYPESCRVEFSSIHHYANYGIRAIQGSAAGLTVTSSQIVRGKYLDASKGIWGIYAEEMPSLRVSSTKIYDYDHADATWEKPSEAGGGIRIVNDELFCQTTLPTPDSVVVRSNTLVGPGETEPWERNGLQLDWACGTSNREVVVDQNAVVQWYRGLQMDENRDTYVTCNRFENNRVGVEFYRADTSPGLEARLKRNHVQSSADKTVLVEQGMEHLALGSATTTVDRGLNKFEVETPFKYYVTQFDGTFTSEYLNAQQNHWFDVVSEPDSAAVVSQCEPLPPSTNRTRIRPTPTNTSDPACVPPSPSLSPPPPFVPGALAALQEEVVLDERGGEEAASADFRVDLPLRSGLLGIGPNPARGDVRVGFAVGQGEKSEVRIGIYDVAGRRVTELIRGMSAPGWRDVVWSGLDSDGQRVGAGVYFVRFEAGTVRETRKVVHLR